jgi:hypothetical protein
MLRHHGPEGPEYDAEAGQEYTRKDSEAARIESAKCELWLWPREHKERDRLYEQQLYTGPHKIAGTYTDSEAIADSEEAG